MNLFSAFLLAAIIAGSWNAKWFPSGRAMHRADPKAEEQTIKAAGAYLRSCIEKTRKAPDDDVIICLNEIHGKEEAYALCSAIGITNLDVAVISRYRLRNKIDTQQDAILTTLPIQSSSFSQWKHKKRVWPPRGEAKAILNYEDAKLIAYSIHLKSHYGETSEQIEHLNDQKRQLATSQIASEVRKIKGPLIVAGDFNMDFGEGKKPDMKALKMLTRAGLQNQITCEGDEKIITFPGNKSRPGSTLDYIMTKNMEVVSKPKSFPIEKSISDHYAVFILLK